MRCTIVGLQIEEQTLSSVISSKMQRSVVKESDKRKRVEDKWVIGKAEEPTKVCNVHLTKVEQSEDLSFQKWKKR